MDKLGPQGLNSDPCFSPAVIYSTETALPKPQTEVVSPHSSRPIISILRLTMQKFQICSFLFPIILSRIVYSNGMCLLMSIHGGSIVNPSANAHKFRSGGLVGSGGKGGLCITSNHHDFLCTFHMPSPYCFVVIHLCKKV